MLARAIDLSDHPWREEHVRDGIAVAQFDELAKPGDPRVVETTKRWKLSSEAALRLTMPITCATDGKLKLVRDGDHEWLYDLVRDPLESAPSSLADGASGVVPATLSRLQRAVAEAAVTQPDAEAIQVDISPDERADLERGMRFLGYM